MAPTIRTCKRAFALALCVLAAPAAHAARDASPLGQYAKARLADADGRADIALQAYADAMSATPGNTSIALRTFRQALESGNKAIALRAARQLEQAKAAPPDASIVVLIDRLESGDLQGATLAVDRLEEHGAFGFMVPVARAWIAYGRRDKDPIAPLRGRTVAGANPAYLREHEALLYLALKQRPEGINAVRSLATLQQRGNRLSLMAAAQLSALGDFEGAKSLLGSDDPTSKRARMMLDAKRVLPGAINKPAAGIGALCARIANDLYQETASPAALSFVRLAQFALPENESVSVSLVQILARSGQEKAALDHMGTLPDNGLFQDSLPDLRIALLDRTGDARGALDLARAEASKEGSATQLARVGDLLMRGGKAQDAVDLFRAAIEKSGGLDAPETRSWPLWVSYGNALDVAGRWDEAKKALKTAVQLAPDQPTALNHLGYAMLERRDDLPEATRLVAKANMIRPDDVAIADSLGWAYLLTGDVAKAVDVLERAAYAAPTEAVIGEHLGDAYWKAGRKVDARYAWNAARSVADADDRKVTDRLDQKIDFGPIAVP